jgi:hypothetical protein
MRQSIAKNLNRNLVKLYKGLPSGYAVTNKHTTTYPSGFKLFCCTLVSTGFRAQYKAAKKIFKAHTETPVSATVLKDLKKRRKSVAKQFEKIKLKKAEAV